MAITDKYDRWERLLPLSGAAYTVLMVIGAAAFAAAPGGDVSPASQPAWLSVHHNSVIAQSYVRALAALAFIALGVALAAACRRALFGRSALPGLALIGGALSGGLVLLAQAVGVAAALHAGAGGSAATIRGLGALQDAFLDLSSLPAVLLFAGVGVTALRTGLLPRWLTVITLLGVPFAVLDALSYDGGPVESVAMLGLFYFLAWSLLIAVRVYVQTAQPIEREPAVAR